MNAGLSGDSLLSAIERIESADFRGSPADRMVVDEAAERRRERDRLRKSAERLRKSADNGLARIDNSSSSLPIEPSKESPLTPRSAESPQTPDAFDDRFWPAYPRRIGKGAARRAWKSAILKTSPETILEAVSRFAGKCAGRDETFIPHPATWLNAERWQDAELQAQSTPEPFVGTSNGKVFVKQGTDAFDAWNRYWRKTRGVSAPTNQDGGWFFPTEYPKEKAA
jgi:hypothetical protein